MSDDLVSGVLTRISEIESAAEDARNFARGGEWFEAHRPAEWGDAEHDVTVLSGGKPIATFHVEYGGALAAVHAVGNDPESILRLCRAHRQIVDEYREVKAAAEADESDISARVGAFALGLAVRALAVGLGVLEEETE